MKVKVRDQLYDGEKEPVMVILTEKDKENIKNMLPEATKYCMCPDSYTHEQIKAWMHGPAHEQ
jgi:hypothetical protein